MKLEQLLTRLNYTLVSGRADIEISDVIYDSRKACKDCVFVCLKGANLDSHKFAQNAVDSGAVAVVVSEDIEIHNATVIKVKDRKSVV